MRIEVQVPRGASEIKLGIEHAGTVKESRSLRIVE
jgi:hypothetical protein